MLPHVPWTPAIKHYYYWGARCETIVKSQKPESHLQWSVFMFKGFIRCPCRILQFFCFYRYSVSKRKPWFSVIVIILHYNDVIMGAIASQITSLAIVYSTVYSGWDQRKRQSSASLAFVRGIHLDRWIPAQMASNAENVSISWRHHVNSFFGGKTRMKNIFLMIFCEGILCVIGCFDNFPIYILRLMYKGLAIRFWKKSSC